MHTATDRPTPRVVVLAPTYNEAENLSAFLEAVLEAQPSFHVLVIDDGSPDGTGAIADARAANDPRIHVLHRPAKEGLGKAYLAGFAWALAAPTDYTHVFEMDVDFSHDPRYLGPMLEATMDGADLAVGSRNVSGGGTVGWSPLRKAISRGGSIYARTVLGVHVRDLTTGFKCFRRAVLEALPLDRILTSGYGFQIELTYRALCKGFRVREIPIVFPDRTRGKSKMSAAIAFEALVAVLRLRFDRSIHG